MPFLQSDAWAVPGQRDNIPAKSPVLLLSHLIEKPVSEILPFGDPLLG